MPRLFEEAGDRPEPFMWGRKEQNVNVKEAPPELKSFLVPVDGSTASMRAVEFACSLAKKNKGKVHVVHVIEVRRSLPLDAELSEEAVRGEEILDRAELAAKRLDFEVEGDLLQAREAGHAIVDEAVERAVDAILIGIPNRRPFGEFEMGKVPAQVLKSARCEVIILRMPADS
jgi:nucleotide-binding universal stress UspA family protein